MEDRERYIRNFIRQSIKNSEDFQDQGETEQNIKYTFEDEEEYKFYFGVPHGHTAYSDGRGTPLIACERVRERGLDFFIPADHSNLFDGVMRNNYEYDYEHKEYREKEGSAWWKTGREVEEINNRYEDFLAIRAFEMSSSLWGHINVINSGSYVEAKKQMESLEDFCGWLKGKKDIVVVINHPHKHFNYSYYNLGMDGVMDLIEVANGSPPRKYRRLESHYFKMLDLGWHLGVINGQDNHRANWGERDNLTVVIARGLTREDFIEALKSRRTYSTETRSLKMTFKAEGEWMGSIVEEEAYDKISFEIIAEDEKYPIKKLELISRGGRVIQEKHFNNSRRAEWRPEVEVKKGEEWYVLKVIHGNGRWGLSSPIFIKGV
jgi:hypothetical protein